MRFSHNPFYKKTDYELKSNSLIVLLQQKGWTVHGCWANFPFVFIFSLSCHCVLFFFALRYFVNYATLLFISFCGGL